MRAWPTSVLLLVVVALTSASGCSLLHDTDAFRTPRPTQAEIRIAPADPATLDDLVVELEKESSDPLGQSIQYIYEWTKDETAQELTAAQVSAGRTRRDETWRVRVTPKTVLDGRIGDSAEAEVTIKDTPPVIRSIGFSNYEPHITEVVEAFPVVYDPDGDLPTLSYEWLIEGAPVGAPSSRNMALDGVANVGEKLEVRVRVAGEGGSELLSSALLLRDDVLRWRKLLPHRDALNWWSFWDPVHRRILIAPASLFLLGDFEELWEYALESSSAEGRYVRLPDPDWPSQSDIKLFDGTTVYDSLNERALLIAPGPGFGETEVWSLGLGDRLRPVWQRLETTGETPTARGLPTLIYDEARSRILVVGGDDSGLSLSEVWSLELQDPLEPHWSRLPDFPEAGHAATAVAIPGENRAFLIGGLESEAVAHRRVFEVLVSEEVPSFFAKPPLPQAMGSAAGAFIPDPVDSSGDRIYVGYGSRSVFSALPILWSIDPRADNPIPTEVAVPGDSFPAADSLSSVRVSFYDEQSGLMIMDSSTNRELGIVSFVRDYWALRPATDTWEPFARSGLDDPPSLAFSLSWRQLTQFVMWGGVSQAGSLAEECLWRYDPGPNQFTCELSSSGGPAGRGAIGVPPQLPVGGLLFFGGTDRWTTESAPEPLDSTIWRRANDSWVEQALHIASPDPLPAERFGHVLFDLPDCASGSTGYFGGLGTEGSLDDTGFLRCDAGACAHEADVVSGTRPSPRFFAAASFHDRSQDVVLFGGREMDSQVWLFDACAEPPSWSTAVIASGAPPPDPRWGHTMTPVGGLEAQFLIAGGDVEESESITVFLLRDGLGGYEWHELEPVGERPASRNGHVAWLTDPERLVIYGGQQPFLELPAWSDMWELRIPGGVSSLFP